MTIKIAKVLGLNTDQKASIAHSQISEENIFLGLLNLTSDDAFTRGRQLLSETSDEYFEDEAQAGEKLENIFAKALENLKQTETFDLLLATVSGKTLYLLGHGRVLVYIKRQGELKPLLTSGAGQLISGFLEEGDRVLFITEGLASQLTDEDLNQSFDYPLEVWEEEMSSRLTPESQESAALLVEVEGQEQAVIPAISSQLEEEIVPQAKKRLAIKRPKLILAIALTLILLAGVSLIVKKKLDSQRAQKQAAQQQKQETTQVANIQQANFSVFLDLELIKQGFLAKNLSQSGDKLLILDPARKGLVTVDLTKKNHQILAGAPQLGDGQYASLNGNLAFVYSKDKGIVRVDSETQKVSTVAKPDKDWARILDIYGFGGNIYLLDSGGQIWKYLPTEGGYSDKREYLAKGVKIELANGLRMQIESSVYVLKSGGEIIRFTRGEKDNFSIGGLDKGIKDPKSFFVSSDTDNLYVLDSGNSRLLVLGKTGEYKAQYLGDKFGVASDLVVDEKDKKVYLLDGSKIYVMDLK